jgi:hypothetical protein
LKIIENLKELAVLEKEFLSSIEQKKNLFFKFHQKEKFYLSFNIVEKIILIQESIIKENATLIEINSSLRYILETLIQTELLYNESEYTFKLFYSIYNHQVNKCEKIIERIEREMEIMGQYEQEDSKINDIKISSIKRNEDIQEINTKHKEATQKLDEKADLEFTMFTLDYKWYGYGLTQSMMQSDLLPQYEKRLKHLQELKVNKAKEIVKDERILQHFDFGRQHSQVFQKLKDNRSWEAKAQQTGLENEYKLVYDLTSALLHSTSYSYLTENDMKEHEIEMALTLSYKYSKKIMVNINEYANMGFYNNFVVINIDNK